MSAHVWPRRVLAGSAAGLVASLTYAVAERLPERWRAPWSRINHARREVTLLEGPAHALGLTAGVLAAGAGGAGVAGAVAAAGSAAFGVLDDLTGDTASKGLKGHLRAAARGRITTGVVKIGGLAATGLLTSALVDSGQAATGRNSWPRVLIGGAVIAGTANLLNLFDLRPGRALKVGILVGAPLALAGGPGGVPAAAAVGAAIGNLAPDLRGEAMLGDTGANALGAVLGTAFIAGRSTGARFAALAALTALTLASEKVSFTRVIESTPVLRELDGWGRTPR